MPSHHADRHISATNALGDRSLPRATGDVSREELRPVRLWVRSLVSVVSAVPQAALKDSPQPPCLM